MLRGIALSMLLMAGTPTLRPVEPPILVSFQAFDPVGAERWEFPEVDIPDHRPPAPVGQAAPRQPFADLAAVVPAPSGSGCSRVVFTRAELVSCFGPWAGLIMCESSGRTDALNPSDYGSPSFGFVQFKQPTWDATARSIGWPHLIGVDPRTTDAATQIKMAEHHAWVMVGNLSPWPTCRWQYGT